MPLTQQAVNAFDYVVIALCGAVVCVSAVGVAFTVRYSTLAGRPAREFNFLWRARVLSQVLAAFLALSQLLRLQVLWGPHSVLAPGGINPALLCRIFTALTFGLLEPAYLLLALFSCIYSVQEKAASPHPNSGIVFFALGFSLPCCAAQLICALFTRIFALDYRSWLPLMFFSTYDTRETDYCLVQGPPAALAAAAVSPPQPIPVPGISPNCAFCMFALFGTLISAVFAVCFLLVAWQVTERIARTVINKTLILRTRMLQLLVVVLLPASIACRGLTVLFQPFQLGFELLRLGNVVCVAGMVLAISSILVLKPVHDAYVTDKHLRAFHQQHGWPGAPFAKEDCSSSGVTPQLEAGTVTSSRRRDTEEEQATSSQAGQARSSSSGLPTLEQTLLVQSRV